MILGAVLAAYAVLGAGCQTAIPPDALKLSPVSLERRQLQTRKFAGTTERDVLAASAGVLQDLGFNIDESETKLGLIVASKVRTAREPYFNQLLTGLFSGFTGPVPDQQKIRVELVTQPVADTDSTAFLVRVTFHRTIWDIGKRITSIEEVVKPEIYRQFFEQLSKSLYLEAQKI